MDLKAIRERAERAMPGPWVTRGNHPIDECVIESKSNDNFCIYDEGGHTKEDADFIANARQDIPALLDYIKTLTDTLQEIKECTEHFYIDNRLKPWLSSSAGPIKVICSITDNALKAGTTHEP